jgi:hypothetical protein
MAQGFAVLEPFVRDSVGIAPAHEQGIAMVHDASGRDLIASLGKDADGASLQALTSRLEAVRAQYVSRLDGRADDCQTREIRAVIAAYDAALGALPALWEKARRDRPGVSGV